MSGQLVIAIMNHMTGELSVDKVSRKVIPGTLQEVPILDTLKDHLLYKTFNKERYDSLSDEESKETFRKEVESFWADMSKIKTEEEFKSYINNFDWQIEWIEV